MHRCVHLPVEAHEQKTVCRRCTATIENIGDPTGAPQWIALTPGKPPVPAPAKRTPPVRKRSAGAAVRQGTWVERRRAYLREKGMDYDC